MIRSYIQGAKFTAGEIGTLLTDVPVDLDIRLAQWPSTDHSTLTVEALQPFYLHDVEAVAPTGEKIVIHKLFVKKLQIKAYIIPVDRDGQVQWFAAAGQKLSEQVKPDAVVGGSKECQ